MPPAASPPSAASAAVMNNSSRSPFASSSGVPPHKPPAYDALVKLLVIGDSAVGKSCLLLRFCDDEFTPSFIATIGLDHKSKVVRIDDATAGGKNTAARTVKIQVWDTAGQEQYKTMTSNFYRSAMGVAIVYDVTYRRSFENVTNWLKNVAEHASEHIVKVLVGNKCDAEGARVVSYAEGQSLAAMHGLSFVETSAKANINVDRLFVELAK